MAGQAAPGRASALPHPGGRLVATPAEAVAAAAALGYPVVVKAVGAELAHKSELGAVALDLCDAEAVRAAATRMARLGEALLVEPMVDGRRGRADRGRGPRPAGRPVPGGLGSGGVLVELLADRALLLLPTTADEVRDGPAGTEGSAAAAGLPRPAGGRCRRRGRGGHGGGALRRRPCRPTGRARRQSPDRPPSRQGCRGGRRPDPTAADGASA